MADLSRKLNFVIVGIVLFLTGCAKGQYVETVTLTPDVYASLNKSQIGLIQNQQDMEFEINRSNVAAVMGGGLLIALMDANANRVRSEKAVETGAPIRLALADFDYNGQIEERTKVLVDRHTWLKASGLQIFTGMPSQLAQEKVTQDVGDALGLVQYSYSMRPFFKAVQLKVDFALYPTREDLKALVAGTLDSTQVGPILKVNSTAEIQLDKPKNDWEKNVERWTQNNGMPLKEAMAKILEDVMRDLDGKLSNQVVVQR